jgi:hypothetical protein
MRLLAIRGKGCTQESYTPPLKAGAELAAAGAKPAEAGGAAGAAASSGSAAGSAETSELAQKHVLTK